MKQIGARQEAGRIGGTGPCGRELCCSTWMTNFHSVGTGAARLQNISLNPQKLAGQCAKLKCCLNYEVDVYEEAVGKMPSRDIVLHTLDSDWYFFSSDPLLEKITYSTDPRIPANLETISVEQAKHIIELNNQGKKPDSLGGKSTSAEAVEVSYQSGIGQDDLTRFDSRFGSKKSRGKKGHGSRGEHQNDQQGEQPRQERQNNRENRGEQANRENRGERHGHGNRHGNRHGEKPQDNRPADKP